MTIEIELEGERRQVTLRREDDRWIAEIAGLTLDVSVVQAGGRWSMLVNPAEAGLHGNPPVQSGEDSGESGFSRISYDIAFEPTAAGELIVHVNGAAIPLRIADGGRGRRGAGKRGTGEGPRTIVAPMPGRIVKVLVKPNEAVSARQPLVVVEAMKMENELRAPRGGTVAEIRVSEGSSVEANTVLVVLK